MIRIRLQFFYRFFAAVGVLFLIAHSIGCSDKDSFVEATSEEKEKITIAQWGQERYLIYLPVYVAIEEGFFAAQGLDVSIKFTGNDDQTFAVVLSGNAQFGVGDPVFAAIAQERGFPARVIGTVVGGVAIWGVTNKSEIQPVRSVEDLKGLRIGTFPAPSTNYTLMKELITSNNLSTTTIIPATIGAQLALLESDSVDIAMVLEPGASLAESKGYRIVFSSPNFYGKYAFTGVTVTQEYIEKHPNTVMKFVRALEQALVASHQDHEIPMKVGLQLFPNLSPDVVKNAVQRMLDENTYPQHVPVDLEGWQRAIQTRLAVGDLKSPQQTKNIIDNRFALEVVGE